jgi:cytochrome c-type biogenesis protein CcmE
MTPISQPEKPATGKKKSRNLKILVTVAIAVLGLGGIAYSSLKDVSYYNHVDVIVKDPAKWLERSTIKVHGYVVAGSLEETLKPEENKKYRTFVLEEDGERILVRHRGSVPDTFKETAETVVTGRLVQEGEQLVLLANDGDQAIAAKCPSKYNGK